MGILDAFKKKPEVPKPVVPVVPPVAEKVLVIEAEPQKEPEVEVYTDAPAKEEIAVPEPSIEEEQPVENLDEEALAEKKLNDIRERKRLAAEEAERARAAQQTQQPQANDVLTEVLREFNTRLNVIEATLFRLGVK